MEFEWDPNKAANNLRKHGVRFAEAITVFEDDSMLTMLDETLNEERFVALGLGSMGRILVVVYTARGDTIRVISARKATRRERFEYGRKTAMKKEYDFSRARRGPLVPPTPGKTRITIRLDNDVIEHFQDIVDRAGGGNYQTLINNALREYIRGARLEGVVRKAVREEIRAAREVLAKTA